MTTPESQAFWANQRVIVTGGSGFLGRNVVAALHERGATVTVIRRNTYDLRREDAVKRMYAEIPATMVIHMAAIVGGIGANREHPGSFFYDNLMMGALTMEYARQAGIEKFVSVGTICAYPKYTPVPFKEDDLYGFNSIYLMPTNLYGPADNFDPRSSHVIPALIRKCVEAKQRGDSEIEIWGDGTPTREFLYVKDAAEGIVLAAERYNDPDPVNLGSGMEISIRDLAGHIAEATGFTGRFRFDPTKPNGQPRRQLDVSRAAERFGFRASTPFPVGLRETVAWYLERVGVKG
jgi:GDP-L-fucose synthase